MLNKLKAIKECITFLQDSYHWLPIEDPNRPGYQEAIDNLESYLTDEEDMLEEQYGEYAHDKYAESKYCF
jgi:hypothetical protein